MSGRTGVRAAFALVVLAAVTVVVLAGGRPHEAAEAEDVWRPTVPPGRVLVANERDTGTDAEAVSSQDWFVTSGSWFARDGAWWSGHVDGDRPDVLSQRRTGSAVLRVVSRRLFADCRVSFDLRLAHMTSTRRTPPRAFDGVHVFLRYRDAGTLYAVSVARRDGIVVVKKKVTTPATSRGATVDEEGYSTLATATGGVAVGSSAHIEVSAVDVAGGVRLSLAVDGVPLLDVLDDGSDGRRPLSGAGRVGIRADNSEVLVSDFSVQVVPAGTAAR